MNRRRLKLVLAIGVMSLLGAVGVAVATGGKDVRERLTGYEETPQALSTPANGEFRARVSRFSDEIQWRLSYRGFESDVTQAHIHFGARATSGGISVWLCANNPPTDPPAGTAGMPTSRGHGRRGDRGATTSSAPPARASRPASGRSSSTRCAPA